MSACVMEFKMIEYVLGAILLVVSFICGVLWNGKKEQEKITEKAEEAIQEQLLQ